MSDTGRPSVLEVREVDKPIPEDDQVLTSRSMASALRPKSPDRASRAKLRERSGASLAVVGDAVGAVGADEVAPGSAHNRVTHAVLRVHDVVAGAGE